MENLNYSDYVNRDSDASKNSNKLNNSVVALANRPLMPIKNDCGCDKKQNSKPVASEDLHKTGNLAVNSSYSEHHNEILPAVIKPGINNDYVVLEHGLNINDLDNDNPNDKRVDIKKKLVEQKYKMDYATTFYVGSLTVVGLFVFYRLIQKTR